MAFQATPAGRNGEPPQRPVAATRACLRLVLAIFVWLGACTGAALAQPVPGEVSISTDSGFARLVFRFRTEVRAQVRLANGILIVGFSSPVDVNVDRLNTTAPDYVSAARLDPDGRAVRIALARKVKANLLPASERLFLDLLPESWTGLAPGLPQEVVEELSRRVRQAEQRARVRQQLANWKKVAAIRVRVAAQPTFTRYTFPLSNIVAVASDRTQDGLTLVFDAPLRFDLADAVVTLPPFVTSIEPKLDEDTASVRFAFNRKVDVRTFREDNNYVVDVSATAMARPNGDAIGRALEELQQAAPAAGGAAVAPATAPNSVPSVEAPKIAPAPDPAAAAAAPARAIGNAGAKPPNAAVPPIPAAPPTAAPSRQEAAAAPPPRAPRKPPPQDAGPAATTIKTVPATPAPPPPPSPSAGHLERAGAAAAKPTVRPAVEEDAGLVRAEIKRYDNSARIYFPFATPTPAAVFRRADVMWLVFDTEIPIDVSALRAQPNGLIRNVAISRTDGQVIRLKLDRPRLGSAVMQGTGWAVTISDSVDDPVKPILLTRAIVGPARASIVIPFDNASRLHRISDPDVGDTLLVVSALAPVRGFLKPQEFLELRMLASSHGLAVQPLADDVIMQIAPERIVVGRPDGLTLSAHVSGVRGNGRDTTLFNIAQWKRDHEGSFFLRQSRLINAAAAASAEQQSTVHVNLANFYLARQMFPEAKGALDMALSGEHAKADDASIHVLRAVAQLMAGRTREALKDLSHPSVGNQHDAPLWRALAHAQEGKWAEAREGFKIAQMSIGTLPIELQRFVLQTSVRAALEVGDIDGAAGQLNDFETIGVSPEHRPDIELLRGRVSERLGRMGDALSSYQSVLDSKDRRAATQARLRQAKLQMSTGDLNRADAIAEFETISVIWRGDETEIEALQSLARLYTKEGRLRDAFGVMRAALTTNSRSDRTRRIQDEAAATFESLFLSGKGEALPAIDALSLFYDFRDLTPMGRRGDEMIRRLADRLVAVDLLDQAAELLQHQVDKRLRGAARAQVATRLAMIYLMNNKPDRALRVLRATHIAGFSDTLRNRRLLLESRALSELSRPDVALEVIANIKGHEADRMRADILWKARRWRDAAEQIERALGDRWVDWQPLDGGERNDVLRAGIGYALGKEPIGTRRLRERYAAKMTDGPDRRAFDVVTSPLGPANTEFGAIASNVGSIDTLERFLRDLRAGFSSLAAKRKGQPEPDGQEPPAASAPAEPTPASPEAAAPKAAPTTGQAPSPPATAPETAATRRPTQPPPPP